MEKNNFKEIIVSDYMRLDKYLSNFLLIDNNHVSRTHVQYLIINKKIKVNNTLIYKSSYKVKPNDVIHIIIDKITEIDTSIKANKNIKFDIVYEDDSIIIIDKPNNLVVHPSLGHKDDTLLNGLLAKNYNLSNYAGDIRKGIVHRIDKDTTGLLIIAKNNQSHAFLSEQLKKKSISREYKAICCGIIKHDNFIIDAPISRNIKHRHKMGIVSTGRKALTKVKVIERLNKYTLVECKLTTGRTHQIRVHLQYIGNPILGDNTYSNQPLKWGQYLHAYKLKLIHPETKKEMIFTSKLPKEFQIKLNELKGN